MYGLIILGLIIVILGLSAGHAALFGYPKSLARVITVAASAIAGIATALILKAFLPSPDTILALVQNNIDFVVAQFGESAGNVALQAIEFAKISTTLLELLVQIIAALLLPLLCVAFFVTYAVVAWIVYLIVHAIIRAAAKKKAEKAGEEYAPASKKPRWLAACLGLAQGVIIVAVLLIPVSGYLAIAQPTLDELTAQGILDEQNPAVQTVQEVVTETNNSFALTAYRTLGGRLLTDTVMSMRVADTKVVLSEELGSMITLVQHVTELSKTEFENYSEEQAEIIRAIGDSFGQSKLLSPIVGDILYAATDAWLQGEPFLGIEKPSMGNNAELLDPLFTALLEILHDDAKETLLLQADVKTTAELVAVLAQNGVFAKLNNTDELLSTLGSQGVVSTLVTTLGENVSMKQLIPEIMNLGVRAIGQVLTIPANTEAVYDSFMDTVADKLNEVRELPEQERIQTLSTELSSAFDKAGIDVDTQVLDFYSTAILHDLVDNNAGEVTPADVQAFFVLYAEGVRDTTSSLSAKPSFDMLSSTDADPYEGTVYEGMTEQQRQNSAASAVAGLCVELTALDEANAAEQAKALVSETFTNLLGQDSAALEVVTNVVITAPLSSSTLESTASMQSTEEMKKTSTVITLESLLVDAKQAAQNINPETVGLDADAISAIFSTATELMDTLQNGDGQLDLASLASGVGEILDSLAKTETFGKDKTASLFTSVLQSETVREKANIDMKTATQLAEKATEGEVNYKQTMSAVAGSVNIMDNLAKDGTISEEELVDLIRNLNAQTAGMIEVYVTPERLVENNIPEKHSVITSDLIKSLFGYIADSDKQNSEIEAKALNQILNLALAAKESDDKQLFSSAPGADDGKLPTATETVNTLLDSKAVRHALVDVLTDGNKVTVVDPYGFSEKIAEGSQSYTEFVDALYAYRDAHPEVNDLVFEALAALMGIEIDM